MTAPPCLFCDRTSHTVLGAAMFWYIRLDNFPANPGHVEVISKRHVVSFFDLNGAESAEMYDALTYARNLVTEKWGEPDAWTIGINDGRAAGRSIDHLHIHLIPRWEGDVKDPRGGIRQCAPNCDPDAWTKETQHAGNGNAEDCPVCRPLIDQPGGVLYPWLCTAADQPKETREEAEATLGTYWERAVLERFAMGGPVDLLTVRRQVAALLAETPHRDFTSDNEEIQG